MNQLKFGKNILALSIFTLITAFVWIGYEVYHAYTKTTVPQVVTKLIQPLNPRIDQKALDDIEEKYQLSSKELNLPPAILPGLPSEEEEGLEIEEEEETGPSQIATEGASLEEE